MRNSLLVALALGGSSAFSTVAYADYTRNIMLVGYWPPTNNMIRRFSTNTTQNPGGWQGANWQQSGYNIYSFFPEFPGATEPNWGKGIGDFEVDYQDTSADFWRITAQIKPCAMIAFTRGNPGISWEIESRNRNRTSWTADYFGNPFPDQSPPDSSYGANAYRNSSLPMDSIMAAVNGSGLGINAYIDRTAAAGGTFLSEYLGYHTLWYQHLHRQASDPSQCFAAGHIHVGISTPPAVAEAATNLTLASLTHYLDTLIPTPGSMATVSLGAILMVRRRR